MGSQGGCHWHPMGGLIGTHGPHRRGTKEEPLGTHGPPGKLRGALVDLWDPSHGPPVAKIESGTVSPTEVSAGRRCLSTPPFVESSLFVAAAARQENFIHGFAFRFQKRVVCRTPRGPRDPLGRGPREHIQRTGDRGPFSPPISLPRWWVDGLGPLGSMRTGLTIKFSNLIGASPAPPLGPLGRPGWGFGVPGVICDKYFQNFGTLGPTGGAQERKF